MNTKLGFIIYTEKTKEHRKKRKWRMYLMQKSVKKHEKWFVREWNDELEGLVTWLIDSICRCKLLKNEAGGRKQTRRE